MKSKKLVYGVGINDADYVVKKFETIGYVNGKIKRKLEIGRASCRERV